MPVPHIRFVKVPDIMKVWHRRPGGDYTGETPVPHILLAVLTVQRKVVAAGLRTGRLGPETAGTEPGRYEKPATLRCSGSTDGEHGD